MYCIPVCNSHRPGYECFTDCEIILVMFIVVLGYVYEENDAHLAHMVLNCIMNNWQINSLLKVICLCTYAMNYIIK